jgi:phosphonate transport system substrate-binding protein
MIVRRQSRKMKKVLLTFFLAILGCTFPVQVSLGIATPTPTSLRASAATSPPAATPQPGTDKNPLILALAPSSHPDTAVVAAGDVIAAFITSHAGYKVVTIIPASEMNLVEDLGNDHAHIASLPPFAYLLARKNETATAILASARNGQTMYGAQIIANRDGGFVSYFNAGQNENTADANTALKQFQDKKPCWSDSASPSGYVVPLGLLNQAQVQPRSGAFLEGQPSVVRAVYAADICDFGATFIDARQSPVLEAKYPDVMDRVNVIWRIPSIIPYENISISNSLPIEMRRVLQRVFIDLMLTAEGKSAVQTVYGIDELKVVEDAAYKDFEIYVNASGLNLAELIK